VPERDFSRSVPQRNTAIAQRGTAEMVPPTVREIEKIHWKSRAPNNADRRLLCLWVHVTTQGLARHGPMSIQELVRARQRQLRRAEEHEPHGARAGHSKS
jgi:hypothetical protein